MTGSEDHCKRSRCTAFLSRSAKQGGKEISLYQKKNVGQRSLSNGKLFLAQYRVSDFGRINSLEKRERKREFWDTTVFGKRRPNAQEHSEEFLLAAMALGAGSRLRLSFPFWLAAAFPEMSSRPAMGEQYVSLGGQSFAALESGKRRVAVPRATFHFAQTSVGRRREAASVTGLARRLRADRSSIRQGPHGKVRVVANQSAARAQRYIERTEQGLAVDGGLLERGASSHHWPSASPSPPRLQGEVIGDRQGPISLGTVGAAPAEREFFWFAVEAAERRRDARLQTRIIAELPHWLPAEFQRAIVRRFGEVFSERGLLWWSVVHGPDVAKGSDPRNVHMHLLYHDRPARRLAEGGWDFAPTKDREVQQPRFMRRLRERYSEIVNEAIEAAAEQGIRPERLYDPRSYREAGVAKRPTRHLGQKLTGLERSGEPSMAGEANRRNEARWAAGAVAEERLAAARKLLAWLEQSLAGRERALPGLLEGRRAALEAASGRALEGIKIGDNPGSSFEAAAPVFWAARRRDWARRSLARLRGKGLAGYAPQARWLLEGLRESRGLLNRQEALPRKARAREAAAPSLRVVEAAARRFERAGDFARLMAAREALRRIERERERSRRQRAQTLLAARAVAARRRALGAIGGFLRSEGFVRLSEGLVEEGAVAAAGRLARWAVQEPSAPLDHKMWSENGAALARRFFLALDPSVGEVANFEARLAERPSGWLDTARRAWRLGSAASAGAGLPDKRNMDKGDMDEGSAALESAPVWRARSAAVERRLAEAREAQAAALARWGWSESRFERFLGPRCRPGEEESWRGIDGAQLLLAEKRLQWLSDAGVAGLRAAGIPALGVLLAREAARRRREDKGRSRDRRAR